MYGFVEKVTSVVYKNTLYDFLSFCVKDNAQWKDNLWKIASENIFFTVSVEIQQKIRQKTVNKTAHDH